MREQFCPRLLAKDGAGSCKQRQRLISGMRGDEVAGYTCLWEFRVAPASVAEFEKYYAPDGEWAQLFRRSHEYLETLLLRDADDPLRYVTIDRWQSTEAYSAFRSRYRKEYQALDARCEVLTTNETRLGEFADIG